VSPEGAAPEAPSPAVRAWGEELAAWALPDAVVRTAAQDPWAFPVELFRVDPASPVPPTPSSARAAEALGRRGTVLDVGCGGGAASVPLAGPAAELVGVDRDPDMLDAFRAAAAAADVGCRTVCGSWPGVAGEVPVADVVLCHHVVYNVADIAPFLVALTGHARRRVVVELTDVHPQSALNPLWRRFWGIERPTGPTAATFVQIVNDLGYRPKVERFERPARKAALDRAGYVAFVRRRLCLGPERDPDVDVALGDPPERAITSLVSVFWDAP
jgi:SAM-dependent methyltransferase